jgi:hypothetical protein
MKYDYIAEIDSNKIVLRVLVGSDTQFAQTSFGGNWIPVYAENYCGIGGHGMGRSSSRQKQ